MKDIFSESKSFIRDNVNKKCDERKRELAFFVISDLSMGVKFVQELLDELTLSEQGVNSEYECSANAFTVRILRDRVVLENITGSESFPDQHYSHEEFRAVLDSAKEALKSQQR